MRSKIVNFIMSFINNNNDVTAEENEIIIYGLETFYIIITKTLLIGLIMYFFNMLDAFLLFFFIYGIIRSFSFGVHAKKSWICTIISILIYMFIPSLCKYIHYSTLDIFIIGILCIYILLTFSPADTEKRPIISLELRKRYRNITVGIAVVYVLIAMLIKNTFISNLFIFALVVQSIMVLPVTYRFFGQQYNNYRFYDNREEGI